MHSKQSCGTVFEVLPPASPGGTWTETVLHAFTGAHDGAQPQAALVMDRKGILYGTTRYGGNLSNIRGQGTVFQIQPGTARRE